MKSDEEKDKAGEEKENIEDQLLNREIPPANFYSLVTTFQISALQFLGELKDPSSEETLLHPPLAKYYIDCLGILDEKTKGNLSEDEAKALDNVITQLRLLFVKASAENDKEES
jgi:hypothetical protein